MDEREGYSEIAVAFFIAKGERRHVEIDNKLRPAYLPVKCVVCSGFGTVNWGKSKCHACNGCGYILIPQINSLREKEMNGKKYI